MGTCQEAFGELQTPEDHLLEDVIVLMPIGGMATRAREVTQDRIPKHLIELGDGRPVLDFVFRGLQNTGFRRFVLCVGNLSDQIIDHVIQEDWIEQPGVTYEFSVEEALFGADGAIMRAIETLELEGQGLVVPGDMLLPWGGLAAMNKHHAQSGADVTIGVTSHLTERTTDVGKIVVEDSTNRLLWCYGRTDEPDGNRPGSRGLTSAGSGTISIARYVELCQAYRDNNPEHGDAPLSFRDDVAPWAAQSDQFGIQAFDVKGEALDLGTPANIYYGQANWSQYA